MAKYETKTKFSGASVTAFLAAVEPEERRADARAIDRLMRKVTGKSPRMWGPTIVGYGSYHYKYASGHEGDAPAAAFSPRKPNLTLYLEPALYEDRATMARLGKHSTGKTCLYIRRLSDVDMSVLEDLVARSYADTMGKHPPAKR
jgi:hypothetical protein